MVKRLRARVPQVALASCVTFAACVAQAQEQPSSQAAQQPVVDKDLEEIVVTGSRLLHDGAAAPTPVTTVTADVLAQTAPSNIPDALNRLPQFQLSANQYRSVTFNATSGLQG